MNSEHNYYHYCFCCGVWESVNLWYMCEMCWHHWYEGRHGKCTERNENVGKK